MVRDIRAGGGVSWSEAMLMERGIEDSQKTMSGEADGNAGSGEMEDRRDRRGGRVVFEMGVCVHGARLFA